MRRAILGDILLNMGAVGPLELNSALAYQRKWGTPLGKALVENHLCPREQVVAALARQAGLSVVDLDAEETSSAAAALINHKVAVQHRVVALRVEGRRDEVLVVAIAAPASMESLDAVLAVSGKSRIVAFLATDEAIDRAIDRIYFGGHAAATAIDGPGVVPQGEPEFDLEQ